MQECMIKNCFSYFSIKTYVVRTKKNRLNETVLFSTQNLCMLWVLKKNHLNEMVHLSTQNLCLNSLIRKYSQFHAKNGMYQAARYECVTENYFLISQPKHMLWVLQRTVSMRWFF